MRAPYKMYIYVSVFLLAGMACPARADWTGCLTGPSPLNRCSAAGMPAAIMAAFAAPVLAAGALVTIAREHRPQERAPSGVVQTDEGGKTKSTLRLIPPAVDPYREASAPVAEERPRPKPNPALQFNETATTAALAVTGAAVLGVIISNIVSVARRR